MMLKFQMAIYFQIAKFLPKSPKSPPDLWSKTESKSDGGIGCVHGMEGCQLVTCDSCFLKKRFEIYP